MTPPARLSAGSARVADALASPAAPRDLPLVIDATNLTPGQCMELLHALDDRRRQGGRTFALLGQADAGAGIVALACDAVVALPGARVVGVTEAWCRSESLRDQFIEELEELGGLDPGLAARLLRANTAFSWSDGDGFRADGSGTVKLAEPGRPIRFDEPALRQVGLLDTVFPTAEAAVVAIEAGAVRARRSAGSPAGSPPPGTSGSGPQGSAPAGNTSSSAGASGTGSTGAPAATTGPDTPPGTDDPQDPRLTKDLAVYGSTLASITTKLKRFDDYFTGEDGTWTTQRKSLEAVWRAGDGQTKDMDTKMDCERLQRDMKSEIVRLRALAKRIASILGDPEHPEAIRTKANQDILDDLYRALDGNKADQYLEIAPKALKCK